jgi:hypothetical protein
VRLYIWENDREIAIAPKPKDGWVNTYGLPGNVWKDGHKEYDYSGETCAKQIDREPDRIVEIDTPCVVAFNGGGYD